jgi:hypothetical protein
MSILGFQMRQNHPPDSIGSRFGEAMVDEKANHYSGKSNRLPS